LNRRVGADAPGGKTICRATEGMHLPFPSIGPRSHPLRAACREAFGVGVADMYSASETGYIALQCPVHDHYHVQSEAVLVEVLNEAGRPCGPGEIGSVVVTPFLNYAMPLIRYAIGDYATRGRSCSCGRNLPVLQEICGRTRDLLVLPSGERRYTWISMRTFAEIPDIVQHQVVQKTLLEIEVKLVVRRPLGSEGEADLRRRLAETMGEQFVFSFTYHDAIPRAPSGKFFAFISELPS
jgi:phenylacetate-CoA ligase